MVVLECVALALTVLGLFHPAAAVKYDFGYSECTYNTFKFRCLGDDANVYRRERSGLTRFPDVNSGVTCLKLKSNKIERFPKYMSDYSTINSLDLSRNRIKELPVNLKDMSKLELLDLSNNGITALSPVTKFPPSLRGLILADNQLTSLPEISIPGLFVFDLSGNQFVDVPWTFCVSKELIRVDFSKNPLRGDTSWYIDVANSCKNRNGVKFCFFVDEPEINCECETIGPLIGFEPNFCLGSLQRAEKFACSARSSSEYTGRKLFELEKLNVTHDCGLLRKRSTGNRNHVAMLLMLLGLIVSTIG